jgi:chemotaxis signal transduction protein
VSTDHVLVFHIGKQLLSLKLEFISEIFVLSQITRIPVAPLFMRHVVSFRGLILPVVDLAPFLGEPIKATVTHKTAIAVHQGVVEPQFALVVDSMFSVASGQVKETEGQLPFFVDNVQALPKGITAWNVSPARIERFILGQLSSGSRKFGGSHEKQEKNNP